MTFVIHIEAQNWRELIDRVRTDLGPLVEGLVATIPMAPEEVAQETASEAPEPPQTLPAPAAPRRGKGPKAKLYPLTEEGIAEQKAESPLGNGHAPEPEPQVTSVAGDPPIDLPALRELMGNLAENHPKKGAIVKDLLNAHAEGAINLSGTDPKYYGVLAAQAQALLDGLGTDPTA